jgi:hypothetical protein
VDRQVLGEVRPVGFGQGLDHLWRAQHSDEIVHGLGQLVTGVDQ